MISIISRLSLLFILFSFPFLSFSQAPKKYNAAEIHLKLQKLNILASVLYIAAHPDDENTRMIAYLGNEKLANTAYLSATRGDGGQNLIGSEMSEYLGIIRTQELLEARKMDGGRQFFTRANDFGFSKSPEETFNIWDKEDVLADMVWVLRNFRPDVIITRFTSAPSGTHGHHTASAILAEEAFEAAGDASRFPEQLEYTKVWQPKKLYWNTSSWFYGNDENFDTSGMVSLDMGTYNPALGKSYTEIAAESRSMHKSQGFGSSGSRGSAMEYLKPVKGEDTEKLFGGIDTNWSRIQGGEEVGKWLQSATENYDVADPSATVPDLLKALRALKKLPEGHWKQVKQDAIKETIAACLGLYLEAVANDYSATPGEEITLYLEAINRSGVDVEINSLHYSFNGQDSVINTVLEENEGLHINQKFTIPSDIKISQPYWLEGKGSLGMFAVESQEMIGLPENPPALTVDFHLAIEGEEIAFHLPVVFKRTDPVDGELYRPFIITPLVFLNLDETVYMFAGDGSKALTITVKGGKNNCAGIAKINVPEGWTAEPSSFTFDLALKGGEMVQQILLYPPAGESEGKISIEAEIAGNTYSRSLKEIDYPHIAPQAIFPDASARVVKLNLEKKGENIGYIMGAGDDVPASLEQIGYTVTMLQDADIAFENLQQYDAVILGVRAYNVREALKFKQPQLMQYVEAGGTMIVQYNTSSRLVTDQLGPYPFELGRGRVTVEEAPVRIIAPQHPVLNEPNKISPNDFENWVQERGLYFVESWDDRYQPILSSNDPGEPALKGGLLVTQYGKGHYIYSGYSWFRELPAGVPGAYRLFTNMISIGK